MLKTEIDSGYGDGGSTGGYNSLGRVCDTCRSATCTIYCRDDSGFLCSGCDARIHAANNVASSHERVLVCEACERAPAAFICKADAASLCTTCDADIHAANPLARRHHRVPILPISGTVYGPRPSNVVSFVGETEDSERVVQEREDEPIDEEDEAEAASWLLNKSSPNDIINNNQTNETLFGGEDDEYFNLLEFNSSSGNQFAEEQYNHQQQQYSVVPFRSEIKEELHHHNQNFQLTHEYKASQSGFDFNGFLNHSSSISPMDVGVVPETTASDDVSVSDPWNPKGTIDLFAGPPTQIPTQLSPVDREARVLRYREKKKTRKFEKTIRYASRKAYAEIRPRIKGRFAKRTDAELEAEQKHPAAFLLETTGYGIVPSF